jgi:hypothetical protein
LQAHLTPQNFENNREFTNHVVATINGPTFGPKPNDIGMQIFMQQYPPFLFGIGEYLIP